MSNAATPKPESFEKEWAKLDLAPTVMRGKADLQEDALFVMSVNSELAISGKLLTRTALAPFDCEQVMMKHCENEDKSAGELVVPRFSDETMNDEQGPSRPGENEKRDDKEEEDRQPEEAPDKAGKYDDKASTVDV